MDLIRILENDDFVVGYDRERGMYRVSYFQDNHFVDECWFEEYKEKEIKRPYYHVLDMYLNEFEKVNYE